MTRFEPLNFFMLRSPLFPIETYRDVFQASNAVEAEKRLAEWAQDPVVRECIAVSSRSLLDSLPNLTRRDDKRKREQAVRGVLRYGLRMMTRPTPFGLFSGVAYGTLAERTDLRLHSGSLHHKRTRPDMEWLLNVVQQLESRQDVVRQLRVHANPMAEAVGTRIQLSYRTKYGQSSGERTLISIRSTPVVQQALQLAQQPIRYAELVERLHAQHAEVAREKIDHFVWTLFQQELLVSFLRPPLMIPSPFAYLLEQLEEIEGIEAERAHLREIADRLAEYDAMPIGQGEAFYLQIVQRMKAVADVRHPMQIDLALAAQSVRLHHGVAEEAARAADVLWRLSPPETGNRELIEYRREFLERYGYGREVPLLELLDEDRGLGIPEAYHSQEIPVVAPLETSFDEKRHDLLLQWLSEALVRKESTVHLTEERVKLLEPDDRLQTAAPLSLEMYFSLIASSPEAADRGEFLLMMGGNPGSLGAGQTFGRFVDILDDELKEELRRIQEREQGMRPDAAFAELVMLPSDGRASNVALSMNYRPYEIPLGCTSSKEAEETLDLSDLVVGMRYGRFYLKSRKLGREVIPTRAHMLNARTTTLAAYRLLSDIAEERVRKWAPFQWGALEKAPYLPRIQYGKTVLSPARWKLNPLVISAGEGNDDDFADALRAWREQWQVPRYVYLTSGDHRILLDLEHSLHQQLIRRDLLQLEASKHLLFTEAGFELADGILQGEDGAFINECVVPLIRKREPERVPQEVLPDIPAVADPERIHFPGGEWLYLKCYGVRGREEEFIGWHLHELISKVEQEGLADHSFFMRYADPKPHVRLRFHGEPSRLTAELLPQVHAWARQMRKQGLMSKLVIDSYDPEIERYGGAAVIGLAERLFAADSRTAAAWIGWKRARKLKMDLEVLAVVSLVDLLEQLLPSMEERVEYLRKYTDPKEHHAAFRAMRSPLMHLADSHQEWSNLRESADGERVWSGMQQRRQAVREYAEAIRPIGDPQGDIVASVLHMHCNRLIGVDREQESKVLALTYLTLNALKHKAVPAR